jgi:hypothetical protein
LLDTARAVFDDQLLEALDHLQRADRIPPDPLREVALIQLAQRPSKIAAAIVVRLRAGLRVGDLEPVLPSLIWLGGQSSAMFARLDPHYPEGLALAADVDLPGTLDELRAGLADADDPVRRGCWAYAGSRSPDGRRSTSRTHTGSGRAAGQ